MRVERVRTVEGYDVGAAEIARQRAHFPFGVREVLEACTLEIDFRAVGIQGEFHLRLVDPALVAVAIAHQEPVRALLDDLDRLAAIDDMENRVATAGTRMHFQIRVGDRHSAMLLGGLCLSGVDGQ